MTEFRINTLPEIIFAHRYASQEGSWHMYRDVRILEITLCISGGMVKSYGGNRLEYGEGDIIITPHDRPYLVQALGRHEHATAAFLTQGDTGLTALLPDSLPSSACPGAGRILLELTALPKDSLAAKACALNLLSMLDAFSRDAEKVDNPHYIKALEYIGSNLAKPITLEETADAAGISCGYLASLFRRNGTTFTQYVNYTRIAKVRQLLCAKDITARQAGEQVGIDDPKYLSRLFRQYCGVSIREFRSARTAPKIAPAQTE